MPSPFLLARDIVKTYGERLVLAGVSLEAYPGQRLGLIGENGAGKSTLLRLLAGAEEPDSGEVVRPSDVGFLRQESPFPENGFVGEVVEATLAEARGIQRRLAELARQLERRPEDPETLAAYGEALEEAEAREVWDADRRAQLMLAGLGLRRLSRDRALAALSGGERSRLALAALLMRRPRALLLDEPTNHLDDGALAFLEEHLRDVSGVVVVASHDRVFLDAVCTGILDLDPAREGGLGGAARGGVTLYGGAYSDYLRARRAERARWEQEWREQRGEISSLKAAVSTTAREVSHARPMKDRNKPAYDRHGEQVQRGISRRVHNARVRLNRLLAHRIAKPPAPLRFSAELTADTRAEGLALSLRNVIVPGRLGLDWLDVSSTERLLVTGPNGAGKSTLLAVLAGRLEPSQGAVFRRRGLRVGFLEQDVSFPDPSSSAREAYAAALADAPDVPLLGELGLIASRDQGRPVGALSAGQRRRLALAILVARSPHVLLLDEPTNHISLALAKELEEAFGSAPGAIVVATHDRWLRHRWEGRELRQVAGRRVAPDDAERERRSALHARLP